MSGGDLFAGFDAPSEHIDFTPTRAAGLARLDVFAARSGRHYAGHRNYDNGPARRDNVSALSPWIRHRLISEEEVLRATLARHSLSGAEKFVQEVFWRSYFKGWLEQRPTVWTAYEKGLAEALNGLAQDQALASQYQTAIEGRTGIDGFDVWVRELVETGYLHNHARMWFASIWIFTLRLPWQLGADFFLRHLMDGDPASNTLSWRWVAGLHTKGKTYLARTSNIAKYTQERFRPQYQLAGTAEPLVEAVEHPLRQIPPADAMPEGAFLLVVTEEDCQPEAWLTRDPAGVFGLLASDASSPLGVGQMAQGFAEGAVGDALARLGVSQSRFARQNWAEPIIEAAHEAGVTSVVTAYAPVGPVAARLALVRPALRDAGITVHQIRRPYDDLAWPHATKGFFALKQKIPHILQGLGLAG